MKLLAIDRGNSRTKVGIHANGNLTVAYFDNSLEDELLAFMADQTFDASIMSTVTSGIFEKVTEYLKDRGRFVMLDSNTIIPIKNNYATLNTLGSDRMAGAVGAWSLGQKKDILLVDAGTCINYECVVGDVYLGGAISPGLQMRLKAMHYYTGKLPLLNPTEDRIELIGTSTVTCMQSGAAWGVIKEMEGLALDYMARFPAISVILTGGDAPYLGKYLKNSIFAPHNEVVLVGLLEILKYNLNVKD